MQNYFVTIRLYETWLKFTFSELQDLVFEKNTFIASCFRGRVVRVIDLHVDSPALRRCGFEFRKELFWILSCEETIQLAYGMAIVILRRPLVSELIHTGAPKVFLHQ